MANLLSKLVYVKKNSLFTSELQSQYQNSIVFIEDTGVLWTHGHSFGLSAADLKTLQDRVTAVEEAKWFNGIAEVGEGKSVYNATAGATTIKFGGDNIITVTVNGEGVKISAKEVSAQGDSYVSASGSTNGANKVTVSANVKKVEEATTSGFLADAKDVKDYVDGELEDLDTVIASVGLGEDGSHQKTSGNYTSAATTVVGEIAALDTALKSANDAIDAEKAKFTGSKTINASGSTYETSVAIKFVNSVSGGAAAHIALVDSENKELSTVNVSDLIGKGNLASSKYDKTTGKLTLTFNQADGTTNDHEIDLTEILDINDVSIDTTSQKYLSVNLTGAENSQAVFSAIIQSIATASASATGLADANDVKTFVEGKITGLAKTSTATKGTNVEVKVSQTNGIVSIDEVTETYAGISEGSDGIEVTTASGLVKGSDIETVVDYLEEKIESVDVSSSIAAEIAKLDADVDSTGGSNVKVKVTEEDGKVTAVTVGETYATVTKSTGGITVGGTKTGLVKGSDIETLVEYIDGKTSDETSINNAIEALDSTLEMSDESSLVSVKIVETDGKLVSGSSNVGVTYGVYGGTDGIAKTSTTKTYVDTAVGGIEVTAQGDSYVSATQDTTDKKKIVVKTTTATVSSGGAGLATAADTKSYVDAAKKAVEDQIEWVEISD